MNVPLYFQFTPNSTLPKLDVQHFINAIQHMSDSFTALMNISSVDFTGFDLSKISHINETVIMDKMIAELNNLTQVLMAMAPAL